MLQQDQRIDIPLDDEGLNEERNERTTDVGYRTLDNFVFTDDGSLRRRYGHTSVNTTVLLNQTASVETLPNQPSDVRRVTTYGNTALVFDKDFAYSVATGPESTHRLVRLGWMPQCGAFREQVTALSQSISYFDCAWGKSTNGSNAGYHIFTYAAFTDDTTRNIYATVIDAETGTHLFHDYNVTNSTTGEGASPPRIAVDGHYVIVTYRPDTSVFSTLQSSILDLDTMTWDSGPTTLMTGAWDVLGGGSNGARGFFHIVQQETSGGTPTANVCVSRYYTTNGALETRLNVPTGSTDPIFNIGADFLTSDNTVWVTYIQGTDVQFTRVDNACTSVLTSPSVVTDGTDWALRNIISIACNQNGSNAVISWGDITTYVPPTSFPAPAPMSYVSIDDTGATAFTPRVLYSWFPYSRVANRDGRFYQQVVHSSNTYQATECLVDLMVDSEAGVALGEPRLVARYAPRLIGNGDPDWMSATSMVGIDWYISSTNLYASDDDTLCGGVQITSLDNRYSLNRVQFNFGHNSGVGLGAELSDYVYLAGGTPMVIDKRRPYEQGHTLYPETNSNTDNTNAMTSLVNSAGGALNASANYGYKVTYVHHAANGDADVSAPADWGHRETNANSTWRRINVIINSPYLTAKHDSESGYVPDVFAQVYRTVNYGGVYYYSGKVRVYPNSQQVTYTDNVSDNTLLTNPVLYTEGGFLDNISAPSLTHLCAHKNRIFGIGDDRKTIWYSKRYVSGEVPGFNEALTFSVDDDGQPLLAICSLDDKLILFKESKIYYVTGDGPSPGGIGGTLSEPTVLNNKIGCTNPRSVVVCPDGAFFQAPDTRIYLLTRGLEVVPVGKKVQSQTNTYSVCAASYVDDTQQQVRFCMLDEEGGATGVELAYDYERKKWSRMTFNGTTGFVGAAHVNGVNWKVTTAGELYYEDKTRFNDNNVAINAVMERSWFKPAGPQGTARMTRVGVLYDRESNDVALNVSLANGFSPTYHQNTEWTTAQLNTLGATSYNLQVVPTRQESAAFSVKIREVDNDAPNAGRGVTLTGLSFTFGVDKDQVRVPNGAQK